MTPEIKKHLKYATGIRFSEQYGNYVECRKVDKETGRDYTWTLDIPKDAGLAVLFGHQVRSFTIHGNQNVRTILDAVSVSLSVRFLGIEEGKSGMEWHHRIYGLRVLVDNSAGQTMATICGVTHGFYGQPLEASVMDRATADIKDAQERASTVRTVCENAVVFAEV